MPPPITNACSLPPEITTLLDTFHEYTGSKEQAFVIGGGTYARHFKRAVAFGPYESIAAKDLTELFFIERTFVKESNSFNKLISKIITIKTNQ